jgi:hypothetical protein
MSSSPSGNSLFFYYEKFNRLATMKIWGSSDRVEPGGKDAAAGSRGKTKGGLAAALAGFVFWVAACGQLPPLPAQVDLAGYTPITYHDLLAPGQAKLKAGQKIKVPAYFWEFLTYDPDMVRTYLNMARHPLSWYKLEWFATYGTPNMQGYFDLAALDSSQKNSYRLHRLDHVMLYGELAPLGPGLYLRVHHIEKIEEN